MFSEKLKNILLKEAERVSLTDKYSNEKGAEPLLLSLLFIMREFDGTKNAKYLIEMRRHYCKPVIILEQKVILDEELKEIL